MKYEWDEAKRLANIHKHGIDFREVPALFEGPSSTFEDDRLDYSEQRLISIGFLRGLLVVVVYVWRNDDTIRIISARKATKYEQEQFFS
jgi:uncharacterized protein